MAVDIDDLTFIAEKLTDDYDFYQGKRIFLTGGTGFVGKWILESLVYLNNNHKLNVSVTVLSRTPQKFIDEHPILAKHKKFNFVQGDIRTFKNLDEEFDLIIHAATDASAELNKTNPELMRSTIMEGTLSICELAKKIRCKRILYTSSGAAYGPQPENLSQMPETFTDNPLFNNNDAYSSSKLESEQFFIKNASCEVILARCFSFAGPYLPLDGTYAFGNFINDVLNQRDIVIEGDGTSIRSYLYAAELVVWLLRLLAAGKDRELYNVGSDNPVSIFELAKKIAMNHGDASKIRVLGLDKPSLAVKAYVPSVNKVASELNLTQIISLDSTISKTLEYIKKNA
jgi:dTDP-glucose 4,6-dehydratase